MQLITVRCSSATFTSQQKMILSQMILSQMILSIYYLQFPGIFFPFQITVKTVAGRRNID
jgi:hypothetical protein